LIAEGFLKQWLPNGKLLLLSLTKCHGVPCSLPSRIATKVLKNCKTFSSRPRRRPRLSFLFSRRLETKTLVSRTTSLDFTLLLRRTDGMHVSKKLTVISFKSVTSKNTHLTYLLSIFYCVVAHIASGSWRLLLRSRYISECRISNHRFYYSLNFLAVLLFVWCR